MNLKETIQVEATHLAPGEVMADTYWAVAGDYTFRRCADQTEAVALCTDPAPSGWRSVELRAVIVRPNGVKLDTPLMSYRPAPVEPQPFVRTGHDGHPTWHPGDDLEAALAALAAYTTEGIRLAIAKAEADEALEAYTAEHGSVIDWLAYNEALHAWDRDRQSAEAPAGLD